MVLLEKELRVVVEDRIRVPAAVGGHMGAVKRKGRNFAQLSVNFVTSANREDTLHGVAVARRRILTRKSRRKVRLMRWRTESQMLYTLGCCVVWISIINMSVEVVRTATVECARLGGHYSEGHL
jgi:hypothetical protein